MKINTCFCCRRRLFLFGESGRAGPVRLNTDTYQDEYRYRYWYQYLRDEINTFVSFPLQPLADYSNFLAAEYHKQKQQFLLRFCFICSAYFAQVTF